MNIISRFKPKISPPPPKLEEDINPNIGIKKCEICEKNIQYKFVIPSQIRVKNFSCTNCGYVYII